ncbi:hypothetical protein [Mycoplasma sp. 125]|uniref:hypothetical protein n=1 Tax=Mycoplasma sp. 125 TaxID=3447505 RepID=UPI003F657342
MKKTNRRKKVVAGIITGVSIGATIGTGYVLLNETIKWNHTMAKLQVLIKKMNEWKKQNEIDKKTYTHDLYATFEKELNELEQLLNIKDIKKVDEILTKLQSSKINFKNYKSQYDNLELLNGEAISEKSSFSDLLTNYESKYNNKPFATKYITIYNQEKTNLENQYNNATNEDGLAKVKAKAIELKNNLQVLFNLTDEILNAKNIDSKFPSDIKNKGIFEKAIKEAEKILNNANATLEERQKALNSLHEKISEFQKTLSLEKQNLIKQINDLVKDAENYKNTTLDYDKYKNLAKKLDAEITNIKNKMSKDNEIATLREILEKAKPLKSDAQQIKEAIDGLTQELPSSQKLLKEIESASDLFSSQKIEDELKNAINVGNEALKKLDKNSITEALANLNNKSEQASDLITKQKDKLISEITGLIEKGHQQLDKIKSSDEYENNRDQISDAIEKAQRNNNTNTLLGDLVTNKNILDSLLTKTKKQVARDNLTREIAIAKQNLKYTKENNIISSTNEFEKFIQDAEKTLETLDNEQKSVDEIEVEYNNGAKTLKDSYLQKSKEASINTLVEAKKLNTELEQEKFKDNGTYHVSKKDLQSRIDSAEATNSNANSNSYNVLEKLNELNKAIKEAKRFRDADENERKKIIEEIIELKKDIISKKNELIGAQNGLKNENSEKYKTLIKELDKVLEDYNTNIEPNVSDFGVARLDDVKVNLKKIVDKIPKEKEEINKKFSELNTKLDELVKKANDFVSQMPTDEYNPEKQDLKDLITKTQDPTNRDAIDELKQLVEDFKDKNRKAETKIIQINSNKDEEIEKINNKIAEITDFANANKDEYPQITTPLLESLKLVKDNNYPSYNNTIQELQQKLSNITSALDNAKQLLSNTQNKEQLSLSTNQLEAIKDSIKSNDDEMMQLKHNLDVEIQKAREIIAKEQTDKYTQEKQTIDNLKQSAEQQIIDFEQKLTEAKSRFNQAKESANSVLEQAKSDPNSANYADIITKIKEKISQNDVIDENGPLKNIDAATAELNGLASFYNAEKEKADAITQTALDKLNQEIENAEQIKNTMEQEPDLDTQKAVLEKAIEVARTSHMQSPKLTNNAIKQAQDTLKQAEDVANDAIDKANKRKDGIRTNIAQKEVEIQNYINNVLMKPEYEAIKNDLDAFLKSYEANDKNLLGQKTRQQLDDLVTQMNMHLDSAKQKKDEKDAEIRAKNKQALAEAKEALTNVSNSITSKDPKMIDLRNELNQAISESEAIITNEESDKYVSQKEKLENLSKKAETTKTEFAKELQNTKEAHAQKILDVRNKISQLQADENAANLNNVIQELQQAITDNQTIDDNLPLSEINNKKDQLQKAIETAENKKNAEAQKTNEHLAQLQKAITDVSATKDSMTSEPLLSSAQTNLEQAIAIAQTAKNQTPKLANNEIDEAKKTLLQAENIAKQEIKKINDQKDQIKNQINQKETEIRDYINTDLAGNDFKNIKSELEKHLNDYVNNEKNSLSNKTKQQLTDLLSKLDSQLQDIKNKKQQKDLEIREQNKQKLTKIKETLKSVGNSITSHDPEMTKLKQDINTAVTETEGIISKNEFNKYISQISKIESLKTEANKKISDFTKKLNAEREAYRHKLQEANNKVSELQNDANSANLNTVIQNLQNTINQNNNAPDRDPISSFTTKKNNLDQAIKTAEREKAVANQKTEANLAKLGNTIDTSKTTLNSINSEPLLSDAKNKLSEAIKTAEGIIKNHTPKKLADKDIENANKTLLEAKTAAEQAITDINSQKDSIKTQINQKAKEIEDYKNNLNGNQYDEIKNKLKTELDNFNSNNKNNLGSKTKAELDEILKDLNKKLSDAKVDKAKKDNDINALNKQQLTTAKDNLKTFVNSITSNDKKMLDLKKKINDAIKEAESTISQDQTDKFVEQKKKLDDLKEKSEKEKTSFDARAKQAKDDYDQKLREAQEKLNNLRSDPNVANLTDVINTLQQQINNNQNANINDAIQDIDNKKEALQNAIQAADQAKNAADQKTQAALNKLNDAITAANKTKDMMANESALNSAKDTLSEAIRVAQQAKDNNQKLADTQIESAIQTLTQADNVAKEALKNINTEKTTLRDQISQKIDEVSNFLDTLKKHNEYKEIKDKLDATHNKYKEKNVLNSKPKNELENILKELNDALTEAQQNKNKKDNDIKEANKQSLAQARDTLQNISNSITSHDNEMTTLKAKLDEALKETKTILDNNQASNYVTQKQKLEDLKTEAEQKKKQFEAKLQHAKTEHNKKAKEAEAKINQLNQDKNSANLTNVIKKLQSVIDNNKSINDNDSIVNIDNKTKTLQNAIQNAETEKTTANQKTNNELAEFEKTIQNADATKTAMDNEPALDSQKQTLQQAINTANGIKNASKNATDAQIKEANKALANAEKVAKDALDNINVQKSKLISEIQTNANNVQQYITQNLSNNSDYNQIKTELERVLNAYNKNDKANINSKTKRDLEQLKSKLHDALEKAKSDKTQKDTQIVARNRQNLINAKNQINGVVTRIITHDPEMVALKKRLNEAIKEAERIINTNDQSKYIQQKQVIDNLKNEANRAINDFNNRLHAVQAQHDQKLGDAQAKLNSLKQDPNQANLATIISKLQQKINTNKSKANIDPIKSISDKTKALEQATTNAETQRVAANKKTDAEIAKLEASLTKANATKTEMAKEPALKSSTEALTNAISSTQPAANKTTKLTDAQIIDANKKLTAAEDVAKKALVDINKQKEKLRVQVQQKANAINTYITSNLNKKEYSTIKKELQDILNTYNSQNKPHLAAKTKAQLEEISRNLENELNKAKQKKTKQDSDTSIANKKKEINKLIDQIPYPQPNSNEATQAKNALKSAVNKLNDMQSLNQKQTEITNFSRHMQTKKDQLNANGGNLKYSQNNAQAVQKIKQKLNSAQNIDQANNALPDGWANKIGTYKNVINSSFDNGADKNNLITRLNQTVPTTITGNNIYNENNLKDEIIQNYKRLSKVKIGTLSNIPQNEKNNITRNIDNIQVPSDHKNLSKTIDDIKSLVTNATRQNFNLFIDKLAYPEDSSQLRTDSLKTKAIIKQALTSNIDYSNKVTVEATLNTLKTNIDALKNEINNIKPETKKNEFLTEFSKTDHNNISTLLQNVRKYKQNYEDKRRSAQEVISQITDQNEKKKLQDRLNNSTNSIKNLDTIKTDAEKQKEKEIKQKAEIQAKKQELIEQIKKLPNSPDKKNLLDKVELSKTEPEFSAIKSEIKIISRKIELRKEVDKLALFDLSNNRGGLPSEFRPEASEATKYNLKDLYKLINNASSDSELNTISEKINQQRNAELEDLRKTRLGSNGDSDYGNSVMKLALNQSLSIAVNNKAKDASGTLTEQYRKEYYALDSEIKSADTIEKYKAAKIKAEKFIAKYESKDTKKWLPFFKQRVDSHYKKHPADAGPYNVTIPLGSWSHIISEFEKQDTDRAGAIKAENQALYEVYYKYRRNAKLNYEFLKLIARVKDAGIVDDSTRYSLEQLKNNFEGFINAEDKSKIILESNKQLFGTYNVSEWWKRTSQISFLNWWAKKIANAPESLISQEEKYELLDKIALNTDSTDKAFLEEWKKFKDRFYSSSLIGPGELDNDGYPKNAKPYIWR